MSEKWEEEAAGEMLGCLFIFGIIIGIIIVIFKAVITPYIAIGGMFRVVSSDLNNSEKSFFQILSFFLSTIYFGFVISVVTQSIDSFLVCSKLKRANNNPSSEYENKLHRLAEKYQNKKFGFMYVSIFVVIVISWIIQTSLVWEGSKYIESISEADMVLLITALAIPIVLYILWKILTMIFSMERPNSIVFYRHIIMKVRDRFSRK